MITIHHPIPQETLTPQTLEIKSRCRHHRSPPSVVPRRSTHRSSSFDSHHETPSITASPPSQPVVFHCVVLSSSSRRWTFSCRHQRTSDQVELSSELCECASRFFLSRPPDLCKPFVRATRASCLCHLLQLSCVFLSHPSWAVRWVQATREPPHLHEPFSASSRVDLLSQAVSLYFFFLGFPLFLVSLSGFWLMLNKD